MKIKQISGAGSPAGRDQASPRDIEIAASLRGVIHRLVKILRREAHNDEMLSLTERSTLSLLYHNGQLLASELALMEKVTTQSISQVINHLFKLDYIRKTPSAEDKRKVILSLTDAGKTYIERLRKEKQEWLAQALHKKVSAGEKDLLEKAMKVLIKLVDD